jgi:alanine-glyoxylate transaminase/serine-glyoxylate transaminase/serine-pyruvate transaminase
MAARSFHPPGRTLLGPGPSDVDPRVLAALSRPTIGHLDPAFVALMDELKQLLQYAFRTSNELTIPISGPGSAGMETCFVNLLEPGDHAVVCENGVFGARMRENVERCGARATVVEDPWGQPVDPNKVEDALRRNPGTRLLAVVHAETSTGTRSDIETLARIAHDHDCLIVVDAVTSLAGSELETDGWALDAVYSGSQKCLSCVPGLSPVSFSERAVQRIKSRSRPVQSWFLDLSLVMGYWGGENRRSYHHTAPVNALYALHEALVILREEGLEASWVRHRCNHRALRAGIEAMGLRFLVDAPYRLPQLNAILIPDGIDDALVRRELLEQFRLEIGAGLGPLAGRIWRIGLMGHASSMRNVLLCLGALESVLANQGLEIEPGSAVAAARAAYRNPTLDARHATA